MHARQQLVRLEDVVHLDQRVQDLRPLCAVFRRHLKELGQKYTPERAKILDTLIEMDNVFQADELLSSMQESGYRVSKATIYRTIKLLQDAGIIQQVLVDADQAHYVLAYGRQPRDLLVNADTGEITTIEIPELARLRDKVCELNGVKAQGHRLIVYATNE
ncbi:MAG: transcriptional repressor [Planctomycetota bacterium]